MKINGLNINTEAIGEGIYRMICDAGQEAVVAFGMIPREFADLLERQLREKVLAEAAKQLDCEPTDPMFLRFVDQGKLNATVREIMHAVVVAIFGAAQNAGKMCV